MEKKPESLGRLFYAAVLVSIPPLILTVWGLWLGGWPTPGMTAPVHTRTGFEIDETRWRQRRALEMNDPKLWNEQAAIVILYPPSERAKVQEEMKIDASARIRALTHIEQAEMERSIREVRSRNAAIRYNQAWLFFGMPLSLLATSLSGLAMGMAVWRRTSRSHLALAGSLVAMNGLILLLTYWNACGTSLN